MSIFGLATHCLLIHFTLIQLFAFVNCDPLSLRTAKRRLCPGGYADGMEVIKGRYTYHCSNGKLRPKGCITTDGRSLNLWETYYLSGYQIMCALDRDNMLYFKYVGCSNNGVIYYPGDTWADKSFWYTCKRQGDTLVMEVSGCVYKGDRYHVGEDFRKGDFYFQCYRKNTRAIALRPVACFFENRRYNIGENYEHGQYWFACTMEAGRAVKKCIGCMHKNQRLMDGDRYFENDSIYECTIRQHHSDHKLVGCVQRDINRVIERRLGCQWIDGDAPHRYLKKCIKDGSGAKIEIVSCFYQVGEGGSYSIPPGCFRIYGDKGLSCIARKEGPSIEEFPSNDFYKAYYKGVRPC